MKGIIDNFEAGNSPDAKEGETLRQYIAKKLGCVEKRVSKKVRTVQTQFGLAADSRDIVSYCFISHIPCYIKYECSGYNGRQAYRGRSTTMSPNDSALRLANLAELERKFKESRRNLCYVSALPTKKKQSNRKTPKKRPKALQGRSADGTARGQATTDITVANHLATVTTPTS